MVFNNVGCYGLTIIKSCHDDLFDSCLYDHSLVNHQSLDPAPLVHVQQDSLVVVVWPAGTEVQDQADDEQQQEATMEGGCPHPHFQVLLKHELDLE